MSSHDGGRSVRQSKRYSMTTLYMSMSANEKDLEIEDDLAKGRRFRSIWARNLLTDLNSPKGIARLEIQDFLAIQEEFRPRERC